MSISLLAIGPKLDPKTEDASPFDGIISLLNAVTYELAQQLGTIRGSSATDDLPLGRVREHWDPAVLARKDRETARCESLWRVQFRGACERIIESLDGPRFP